MLNGNKRAVLGAMILAVCACADTTAPRLDTTTEAFAATATDATTLVACSNGKNAESRIILSWMFDRAPTAAEYLDADFFYLAETGAYTYITSATLNAPNTTGELRTSFTTPVNLLGRKIIAHVSLIERSTGKGTAALVTAAALVGFCQ